MKETNTFYLNENNQSNLNIQFKTFFTYFQFS